MVELVSSSPGVKVEAESDGGGSSLEDHRRPGRLHKRAKLELSLQELDDPLEEPSPLGLRLKKTPSFLDLVQTKLSRDKTDGGKKGTASSSAADTNKLKASNFPATLLKIGDWEYKSRYEGDLVGKCYFAKHKLVWEVLDGGLKNKIEIQWSDIVAIKGYFPDDDELETLHVVLARPPLFFRETNPQPRKHTLWQASTDFTGGQASMHKQHYLECQQGFLRKHFEKLVQCDPRLSILSQRPEIPSTSSPYFDHRVSAFGDLNEPCEEALDMKKSEEGTSPSGVLPTTSNTSTDCQLFIGRPGESTSQKAPLTNPRGLIPQSMSIDDLVNYIGHCTSELKTGEIPVSLGQLKNSNILEEITQHLLSDSQFTSSDEESHLMSRVNSFCCLLQKDPVSAHNFLSKNQSDASEVDNCRRTIAGSKEAAIPVATEGENKSGLRYKTAGPTTMPRNNSIGELLLNLPRIASLPRFLPNM
ncbi:unnamed protein product [Linum trigynum]|uniref:TRF2/HOY1 PH-like domain-containing protein n=1 Tax=Linum trigynum TaxID=586398 RepID=A0AAV2DU91_9ROSI